VLPFNNNTIYKITVSVCVGCCRLSRTQSSRTTRSGESIARLRAETPEKQTGDKKEKKILCSFVLCEVKTRWGSRVFPSLCSSFKTTQNISILLWLLLPNVHAVISWDMTPCSLVGRYENDGETWVNVSVSRIVIFILKLEALFGSHNVGIHLPHYTVSQPTEPHVLSSGTRNNKACFQRLLLTRVQLPGIHKGICR